MNDDIFNEDFDVFQVPTPWWEDINNMHQFYGFHDAVAKMDTDKLKAMLEFRIRFLQEELDEMKAAKNADDVVDALIDLCVVAIGTLDIFGVDSQLAWDSVHDANMRKIGGIKPERPNPLGLPDLIKPAGWIAPTHETNTGLLGALDYK